MERLTFRLNEKQEENMRTKYLHFKYFPIPDYDLDRGNPGRITNDMIYNKLGKLEDIEEQLGCPLDVFVKLLFEQKIWIEVDGKMCLTENIDFNINLEVQKDGTYINTLKNYGEVEFWAWYKDWRNWSDHIVLELKDYKKTWWLKENKEE